MMTVRLTDDELARIKAYHEEDMHFLPKSKRVTVIDVLIDEVETLREELILARQRFTNEPPEDCPCAPQCLHVGNCLGKCSLETAGGAR